MSSVILERIALKEGMPDSLKNNHVQLMILKLCEEKKLVQPKLNYNDRSSVYQYLLANFSASDINRVHWDVVAFYNKRNQLSPYSTSATNNSQPSRRSPYTRGNRPFAGATEQVKEDVREEKPIDQLPTKTDQAKAIAQQPAPLPNMADYVTKKEFSHTIGQLGEATSKIVEAQQDTARACNLNTEAIALLQDEIKNAKPLLIEIKTPDVPMPKNIGIQHNKFPELVMACNARYQNGRRLNIFLVGPAATGKSHASEQIHNALFGNKYEFRACGKTLFPHEFMGYYHGDKYVRSQFRESYEHGGIFVGDEFDRYSEGATVALNNCLSGTSAGFPDGMVKRHPDFIFIACGNTYGRGATMDYNTANKHDAATMNRFTKIDWMPDLALEDSLSYNRDWAVIVRLVQKNIEKHKIKGIMITSRQLMDGQALISAGFTIEMAENACLRQGLDDAQWRRVRHDK